MTVFKLLVEKKTEDVIEEDIDVKATLQLVRQSLARYENKVGICVENKDTSPINKSAWSALKKKTSIIPVSRLPARKISIAS